MFPFYCIVFSHTITDDVGDILLETAYLMIKNGNKKQKVRSKVCEGVISTTFKPIALYGTSGFQFDAKLETDVGNMKVSYLVRRENFKDLEESEAVAWTKSEYPDLKKLKWRPNPIRRVATKYRDN